MSRSSLPLGESLLFGTVGLASLVVDVLTGVNAPRDVEVCAADTLVKDDVLDVNACKELVESTFFVWDFFLELFGARLVVVAVEPPRPNVVPLPALHDRANWTLFAPRPCSSSASRILNQQRSESMTKPKVTSSEAFPPCTAWWYTVSYGLDSRASSPSLALREEFLVMYEPSFISSFPKQNSQRDAYLMFDFQPTLIVSPAENLRPFSVGYVNEASRSAATAGSSSIIMLASHAIQIGLQDFTRFRMGRCGQACVGTRKWAKDKSPAHRPSKTGVGGEPRLSPRVPQELGSGSPALSISLCFASHC